MKYGQFCPLAKAAEILGERWMLLVIRELASGATSYTELQRGLGRISPSVLSSRLKELVEHGIVEKTATESGPRYRLTRSGAELAPIIESVGGWGQRWVRSRMTPDELDVELLMLHLQRNFDASAFPKAHAVVGFVFSDLHGSLRRWWILVDDGVVELCAQDSGRPEDVVLTCRLRTLSDIFVGNITLAAALQGQALATKGPQNLLRPLRRWLVLSPFAPVSPR